MKIWCGYGSEHSANLVIIGEFETAEKAQAAADVLSEATNIMVAEEEAGNIKGGDVPTKYPDPLLKLTMSKNVLFSLSDIEQLLYEYGQNVMGNQLIIRTDEYGINVFLSVMLQHGAKIQVYSAHNE